METNDDVQQPEFPGPVRTPMLRVAALVGIIMPVAILLPAWWGRPGLDMFSLVSYLACAAAPIPFGAWIGEAFGEHLEARMIVLAGLVMALITGLAGYGALYVAGAMKNPPETMLVVPLGQLVLVLLAVVAAWLFGRR
jgi:4-amino-4-deoxy-L-arabinose transferase-like glycosyltransferase